MKTYREIISEGRSDIAYILDNPSYFKYDVEVVFLDEVNSIIDGIESEVKHIHELLEPIKGLTEIYEVRTLVNELLSKLY